MIIIVIFQTKWKKAHSQENIKLTWADMCVGHYSDPFSNVQPARSRRASMQPQQPQPPQLRERHRTHSLVASNQSYLHPPPNTFGTKRESSLESGYLSSNSNSTPTSPKPFKRPPSLFKFGPSPGISLEEDASNSPPLRIDIKEKRKLLQK